MNNRRADRGTLSDPEQHEYQVIYGVRDESSLVVFSLCRNRKCVFLHITHTYRQSVSPLNTHHPPPSVPSAGSDGRFKDMQNSSLTVSALHMFHMFYTDLLCLD